MNKTATPGHVDSRAIVAEAAAWFARIRSGEFDEAGFQAWFDESGAHRAAFARVTLGWDLVGELRNDFPEYADLEQADEFGSSGAQTRIEDIGNEDSTVVPDGVDGGSDS